MNISLQAEFLNALAKKSVEKIYEQRAKNDGPVGNYNEPSADPSRIQCLLCSVHFTGNAPS